MEFSTRSKMCSDRSRTFVSPGGKLVLGVGLLLLLLLLLVLVLLLAPHPTREQEQEQDLAAANGRLRAKRPMVNT